MTESASEFLNYYSTIQRKKTDQRAVSGEMSQITKRAREAGIDLKVLTQASFYAKLDPVERIVKINLLTQYLRFLNLPGSEQMAYIQQPDRTAAPSDGDHYQQGFEAAIAGLGRDACPFDATSGAGIHWMQGYDKGLKDSGFAEVVAANVAAIKGGIKALEVDDAPEDTPAFLKPKKARKAKAVEPEPEAEPEAEAPPPPEEATEDFTSQLLRRHGLAG
jgi:ribosome modulation factor/uncharacterized protein (UPF0335 family)